MWLFTALAAWIVAVGTALLLRSEWLMRLWENHSILTASVATAIPALLLWRLYLSLVRPMNAVVSGLGLLSAQDFSSRLVRVGQKDADRIVDTFNSMMQRLKGERLRNIEQNHFLHLLIETSPVGISILDSDGRIKEVNPAMAAFLQCGAVELLKGKTFGELEGATAAAVSATGDGESRVVRCDNRVLRIERLHFIEYGCPRPYVMVESLTDEVLKAEKAAYGKVIRLIAHEVNNTMAGLGPMLETVGLIAEQEKDDELREVAESCGERCSGLSDFITRYADVVRLPEPMKTKIDLNAKVGAMIPFLEGMVAGRAAVEFTGAEGEAPVNADLVMIEQVVVNVVKNAVESIGDAGGYITLRVETKPPTLIIDDDGPGISREVESYLFSPFFSTKSGGQGIGLTMVGEILSRHGCSYSLRSSAGVTRFKAVFPRIQ